MPSSTSALASAFSWAAGVEWDEHNRAHFREHERCSEQDAEDVLYSRYYPTRVFAQPTPPSGEPRFMFHGRTRLGRPLKVVATPRSGEAWRPITCIPLSGRDLGIYTAWATAVMKRR